LDEVEVNVLENLSVEAGIGDDGFYGYNWYALLRIHDHFWF
jgi:hypothetical protein